MINKDKFSKRLKKVIEYHQLSATAFADKIDVQRSSISHLLSGRNKPSLDFVLKVLAVFETVEFYWLISGKGNFPKEIENVTPPTLFSNKTEESTIQQKKENTSEYGKEAKTEYIDTNIEKIVIFYKNGSFKQYDEM